MKPLIAQIQTITNSLTRLLGRVLITDSTGTNIASIDAGGAVKITGAVTPATTVTEYSKTLADVDTEYSQALPAGTKKVFYMSTAGNAFRASYFTGKVATPTQPYEAVAAHAVCYDDGISLASATLYFATDVAGDIIFLRCWS